MSYRPVPLHPEKVSETESIQRSRHFYENMNKRRSLRFFSTRPVPEEVLINCIKTAGTAPSGANKQPWHFCLIQNATLKREIRIAAEKEEKLSYDGRMPEEWLEDLAPLGTDWQKPFLENAPWLIVVFKESYRLTEEGTKRNNYYVQESVGIACGMLITALHQAGLFTLTHTPSPMNFLSKILHRPDNEKPYLLLPVGYPADNATVPDIHRKSIEDILIKYY
jgi:iodotyrosine deiodinase